MSADTALSYQPPALRQTQALSPLDNTSGTTLACSTVAQQTLSIFELLLPLLLIGGVFFCLLILPIRTFLAVQRMQREQRDSFLLMQRQLDLLAHQRTTAEGEPAGAAPLAISAC